MNVIGRLLKEYRIKKNITQEELAELLNITPRQVQRIESGESRPSLRTLKLLIEILEISCEDVVKIIKEIAKNLRIDFNEAGP